MDQTTALNFSQLNTHDRAKSNPLNPQSFETHLVPKKTQKTINPCAKFAKSIFAPNPRKPAPRAAFGEKRENLPCAKSITSPHHNPG